jgi:hypothetical protein
MLHCVVKKGGLKIEKIAGAFGVKFSVSEIARVCVIAEIIFAISIIKVVLVFIVFLTRFIIFLFVEGILNFAFPFSSVLFDFYLNMQIYLAPSTGRKI